MKQHLGKGKSNCIQLFHIPSARIATGSLICYFVRESFICHTDFWEN